MLNKPFKVFIGKNTAVNAATTGGETLSALMNTGGADALGDGVIVILDKNFNVLTPGATVADSDTIYVAMGMTKTFTLAPESGTAITARKIKLSEPIKANLVRTFLGKAYAAKVEQVWTATTVAPTLGREYIVRVVYKDMYEHPGPFTQEWHYTATAADVADVDVFADNVMDVINADPNARVVASVVAGADSLVLTGRPIAGSTTGLTDFDTFDMVMFEPFFNYVTSTGTLAEYVDFTNTTAINYGTGTWEQMRELELAGWGYDGVYNRRDYPVIVPDFNTSTSLTYNIINIEHEIQYKTPNNLYLETTQVKTIIAFHNGVNGDAQQAFVLSQLNPWMASTPAAFPNVAAL